MTNFSVKRRNVYSNKKTLFWNCCSLLGSFVKGQKFNPLFRGNNSDSLSLVGEIFQIVTVVFILFLTVFDVISMKELLFLLVMTTTILWTPQDTRSSKNHQRGKTFSKFVYKNTEEKILFNLTRNLESKLVGARSHLNYFTKCLEKNV